MTVNVDAEAAKRAVVERYNAAAAVYDRVRFTRRTAERLVELAGPLTGEVVVDVGAGTGWATLAAARRVGPTGRVMGIDLAPAMIEQARRKAIAAGLSNVELRLGDAERLEDVPDRVADVILAASSLAFLPDMAGALRSWLRVTRPGGRMIVSTFGPTFRQPFGPLAERRLATFGLSWPQGSNRLRESGLLEALVQRAGWTEIATYTEQLGYFFATLDDYWAEWWGNGTAFGLRRLTPEQVDEFQREHVAEVRPLMTADGLWFDVPVLFVTGHKPRATG